MQEEQKNRRKLPAGTLLAGYPLRITSSIGSGGMAVVYDAEDLELGLHRAVKVLDVGITGIGGKDPIDELRREARMMAKLHQQCPEHIVQVLYVGQTKDDQGRLFIVMERLVGGSVKDLLRLYGPFNWKSAKQIFQNVAAALATAHDEGLVHRDVKPANIYCDSPPNRQGARFLLLDFGIAALMDTATSSRFVGTFKYAAPEQAQSQGMLTHKTDIYSFGVTFYELLAGRHPFAECVTDATMVRAHRDTVPPPLRTFVPTAPVELEQLLASMLAKDPAQRPSSMRRALDMINEIYWDDRRVRKAPEDNDTTVEDIGTVAQHVENVLQAKRGSLPLAPTDPMFDDPPPPPAPAPNGPERAPTAETARPQEKAQPGEPRKATAPSEARGRPRNEISATLESRVGSPVAERPVIVRVEGPGHANPNGAKISVSPIPPPAATKRRPLENVTEPLYGAPALPPDVERARALARYQRDHEAEEVRLPIHQLDWRVKLLGGAALFAVALLSIGILLRSSSPSTRTTIPTTTTSASVATALPVSMLAPITATPSATSDVAVPSSIVSPALAASTSPPPPAIVAVSTAPVSPTATARAPARPRSSAAPSAAASSAATADPDQKLFQQERDTNSPKLPRSGL